MCYIGHILAEPVSLARPPWVPVKNHRTGGVAVSHAQAVSQKTRKQSASKNKKAAAASRSASKGRAKASVKDTKKAAAAKSSNKRSAMPNKTAKTVAKAASSKATASKAIAKTAVAKAPAAKPAVAAPKAAAKPAVPPRVEEKKPLTQRQGFKTNEFVVYPAHGVGQILAIEEQEIAGARLELFVINFMKDKMTL